MKRYSININFSQIRLKYLIPLLGLILVIFGLIKFNKDKKESIVRLQVEVHYENKKFNIINRDSVDFVNCTLSINEYYKIKNINLTKGESYDIWAVEFVHHNGRNFSQNMKPVIFAIWCELGGDKNGYYSKKL